MLRQNVTTCYDEVYNNIFFVLLIRFNLNNNYIYMTSCENQLIKFLKFFFSVKKMLRQVTIILCIYYD